MNAIHSFNTFDQHKHLPFTEMYAMVKEQHAKLAFYEKKKATAFLTNYTPYKYHVDQTQSNRIGDKVVKVRFT